MALKGIKVLEFAGLAPAPFCGMILSDFGASVIRIDRPSGSGMNYDVTARGKRSIAIDLKRAEGAEVVKRMAKSADVLVEPFRTGVMEKLGLGPSSLLPSNPGLVYARLTGYGQSGSLSRKAGHDINYLAVSGVLSRLGRRDSPPTPPVNLLADMAGGGMTCALGVMAALLERSKTGQGQVVDANMVEGAAYVSSWLFKSQEMFVWGKGRGENFLDSGAHFYDTYQTKDGKWMALGSLEPQFYGALLQGLGMSSDELPQFGDFDELKSKLKAKFLEKTRAEWEEAFKDLDACVTPVLEMDEAPEHKHNKERSAFAMSCKGRMDPVPAPRLSLHADSWSDPVSRPEPEVGQHSREVLVESGFGNDEIEQLVEQGVIQQSDLKSKL